MLSKIKKLFNWRPLELSEVHTPPNTPAEFQLFFDGLQIGTLKLVSGEWQFKYTEEFKNQSALKPLVNFPQKDKEYSSHQLWPFFASRIPGPGQPVVKAFLHKEGIKSADEVSLLKEFGKKTIANPYVLQVCL